MGARTQSKACKDHRADAEEHGFNIPGRLTHGLRRWFNSACRNASARTEVVELMTHNAKGEEISGVYQWRRWESNRWQFARFQRFSNGFEDTYR